MFWISAPTNLLQLEAGYSRQNPSGREKIPLWLPSLFKYAITSSAMFLVGNSAHIAERYLLKLGGRTPPPLPDCFYGIVDSPG